MSKQHIDTRVIHGGQTVDASTGSVMTPIYATSTYKQSSPGEHQGFEYSRSHNPTRFAYERAIANLESGTRGFAFASGLAAISTMLELLDHGDHVIVLDDVYGGSYRLFENVRKRSSGLDFTFVDFTDLSNVESAIKENTKMIFIESPSNPLLKVVDLKAIAKLAKKHNLLSVADNTFATPILQRPLELGFDLVVHSATKYIGGHSDIISGMVVVGNNQPLAERMEYLQNSIGAIGDPMTAFLGIRGIKTLALRMQRHCDNAKAFVEYLKGHSKINKLYYPGLESHPNHDAAKQQMSDFGGLVSVDFNLTLDQTITLLESFNVITLAESLGGVESLVDHPAIMTHGSIPKEIREKLGITDGLVRFSLGIENINDLIDDLEQALAKV
ncbi:MAG: cystathionine beta-lyase [Coxiella sp. (in: Bacteria)]|nr:MAG: cystathionine beta-lyase [Coxiella sp. (in: g-proteobacteria)]